MGKSSGNNKITKDDLYRQGPGLSDPGPTLQLTSLGSMPTGPIDFANGGFASQLGALPEGLRQQIADASMPKAQPEQQPFTLQGNSPLERIVYGMMMLKNML